MTYLRLLGLGFLVLLLVACQSGPPATLEERIGAYQWREIPEADSLFLMPAGAEDVVVSSSKRSWDNAIEQRSSLRSDSVVPGESYLSLSFIARPLDISELFSLGQSLSPTSYSDLSLPRRLRAEFPGMATELVREPRLSRYGPYYYATARHGDQLCVFAWQVLESSSGTLPPHLRRLEMEYRQCGGGDPAVEDLLLPFERGQVRPDTGVLPLAGSLLPMRPPMLQEVRQEMPSLPPAADTSTTAFPLPANASSASRASDLQSGGTPSASAASPRRLFNGRPQVQAPAVGSSGDAAFPLPGGR